MDVFVKIAACGVIAAIMITTLRSHSREAALLLSLAACAILLAAGLEPLQQDLDFLRRLGNDAGLLPAVAAPIFKVSAIGLLSCMGTTFCEDAGEKSLARIIELCGGAAAIAAALPIFETALELTRELMRT